MGSSLKKPGGFFHKFDQNVPTTCLSHSLRVLLKNTSDLPKTYLAGSFKHIQKLNLVQFDHKLSKNQMGIWLSIF